MLVFPDFVKNSCECQILWSLCSVDFHTLTLQLPIQTPHSVAPELQVFVSSLQNCQNFSKTSTPQRRQLQNIHSTSIVINICRITRQVLRGFSGVCSFSLKFGHFSCELKETESSGVCSFCCNCTERQILWSLCSVDFHTLTLQLPIQTLHSVAPELQVFVSSLKFSAKRAHPWYHRK